MKSIVVYYSKNGSNKFLAEKIAQALPCDIETLRPRLDMHLLLLLGIGFGNKKLKARIENYDRVILCGPIWMGGFIYPLKSFIHEYQSRIKQLVFVTCCGSSDDKKDEKYGHGLVFKKVESILGEKCTLCKAFPIGLAIPAADRDNAEIMMKTRLNDRNFIGEILARFDGFVQKLKSMP
jgi:menaquinone-dependent protoporphyrinogen IX oxidase